MNKNNKLYSTVAEAAEMTGLSQAYIRELLNRGKIDKNIKIKGTKVGKEWRIDTQSIYELLGIQKNNSDYKKDQYIQELERQVEFYIGQLKQIKSIVNIMLW